MVYSVVYDKIYSFLNQLKQAFRNVFKFKASFIYLALFIFWQLGAFFQAILIKRSLSGDLVVLHYNIDFGIDLIARSSALFLYASFPLIVFIINLIVILALSKSKHLNIIIHYLLASSIFAILMNLVLLAVYLINLR